MGFQPGLAASKLGFLTSPPWRAIRRIGLARGRSILCSSEHVAQRLKGGVCG
jgi:hypothetical protein